MLPAHEIALSADDCRIVRQGLERLIAHWHDHPAAAAAAGVDMGRVLDVYSAIGARGLAIPAEGGASGD